MKYLYIIPVLLMATACSREVITTAHDLEVKLVGTDAAYCVLSTRSNRYSLTAPGTAYIERDDDDLKIDCDDNLSDRRRTVTVESDFSYGFWTYPEVVTVDFASSGDSKVKNGFRVKSNDVMVKEVLTKDSYSMPEDRSSNFKVKTFKSSQTQEIIIQEPSIGLVIDDEGPRSLGQQQVPTPRDYSGRKSYPIQLE